MDTGYDVFMIMQIANGYVRFSLYFQFQWNSWYTTKELKHIQVG